MRRFLSGSTARGALAFATAAAAIIPAAISYAAPMVFVANLAGTNEVPPTGSPATGTAVVIVDPSANTMHVTINFGGLTGNTTASHIHCCEATPGANANVGVATTTPTFPGFPLGVPAGSYDHVLDLTQASSYNPAFIAGAFDPSHTVAGAEAALINGIQNAESYLNVHSTTFPGGEIRGLLFAPHVTPLVPAGAGANALAVAGAVDAVFASGSAPMEFVGLLSIPAGTLANSLQQLAGENENAAAQAGHESMRQFLAMVLDPFAGTRPAGAVGPSGTLWGAAYGSHLKISGRPSTSSHSETNDGGGLAVGLDTSVAPGTVIGAAFLYDHRSFDVAQNFGNGHDNGYQFAVYGNANLETFYISGAAEYSVFDIRTSRAVAVTGAAGTYQARYTGHGFGGRVEAGVHSGLALVDLTPFAALVADSISMPATTESTLSGSSTLAVQSQKHSFERVRSELGIGLDNLAPGASGGPLVLSVRFGWAHEFNNADRSQLAFASFPGQGFTITGAKLGDAGFIAAGLMVPLGPGVTLAGNVEGDIGSTFSYGGSAQLRFSW